MLAPELAAPDVAVPDVSGALVPVAPPPVEVPLDGYAPVDEPLPPLPLPDLPEESSCGRKRTVTRFGGENPVKVAFVESRPVNRVMSAFFLIMFAQRLRQCGQRVNLAS